MANRFKPPGITGKQMNPYCQTISMFPVCFVMATDAYVTRKAVP